ncbi:MAG: EAL domain-containing protein, partial [Myxococcota bacterium]|nr:EAL domain-containing protein [Myxococcota bacterium]
PKGSRERLRPRGGRARATPSFGEALPRITEHFTLEGALGVVVVDAARLAVIEQQYGVEAHQRAMSDLIALVRDLIGSRLSVNDFVVAGETGRNEILVLVFREPDEAAFYKRELPELQRALVEGLGRRGGRVGYPYLKQAPPLQIGSGAALRNPTIGVDSQVSAALREARDEAHLAARIAARRRRHQIFELVLDGKVHSVYEPIVEVTTRTVFGYEALARGPEGTDLHSPAALFATASEQDLLFQLDCLCRQSGLAGARDLPGGAMLFLNVRPTTIHDPSFRAEALCRTLEACRLRPSDVVFEISEQESIGNFDIFREVRDYYRKLGFRIALDDTGAGYASLEAVMELSPDFIKVDRAFVSGIDEDPARQELLRALLSVSDQINAQIIAEGLDTLEELETLGRLGIPYGQGWLFGKPHPLRSDI